MPTAGQDDARSTKYQFFAGPLPVMHPVSVTGLKSEFTTVERPDRTTRLSDQRNPSEFVMKFKTRDTVVLAAVKSWRALREHVDCTLVLMTEDEQPAAVFSLLKVCPKGFEVSDLSTEDDAAEVTEEWTFITDDVEKIA